MLESVKYASVDTECNLQETSCTANWENTNSVTVTLNPKPIKPVIPFELQIKTDLPGLKKVYAEFESLNMSMGVLRPDMKQLSAGEYAGGSIISVCSMETMIWQLTIWLETTEGNYASQFQFTASGKSP